MSKKPKYEIIDLPVGLEVCDRKFSNKVGTVVEVKGDEVKVEWEDGTIWSYVGQNQKYLREYTEYTPKVFRKSI